MKELHIRLSVYHELDEVDTKTKIVEKLGELLENSDFEFQIYETEEQEAK